MKFRSYVVSSLRLFVLLFFAVAVGHTAMAQDMTLAPTNGSADAAQDRVDHLYLKSFEALKGDQSVCLGDPDCLAQADKIKSWVCVSSICEGTVKSKDPIDCFAGASDQFPDKDVQKQINSSLCSVIASPSSLTRKAVLSHLDPGAAEDDMIEYGAYLFALKGSKDSCEEYIKDYLGPYGPKWDQHWFAALSGCRILSHQTTRVQEEKDFSAWFGSMHGVGSCADIVNTEMRNECFDPGATSALAAYGQQ